MNTSALGRLLSMFLLASGLLVSGTARGQWDPGATMAMGANLGALSLSIGNMSLGRQSLRAGMAGATRRQTPSQAPTPPAAATLGPSSRTDFIRSPNITRQVEDRFIAAAVDRGGGRRQDVGAAFRGADIMGAFEKLIAPYGYRSTDLADVMTAYWIVSWALARNAPDPQPPAIRAVRNALKVSLSHEPQMPQEDMQRLADTLIYQTMLEIAAIRDRQAKADLQGAERIRMQILHDFTELGIRLDRLDITDGGFVGR